MEISFIQFLLWLNSDWMLITLLVIIPNGPKDPFIGFIFCSFSWSAFADFAVSRVGWECEGSCAGFVDFLFLLIVHFAVSTFFAFSYAKRPQSWKIFHSCEIILYHLGRRLLLGLCVSSLIIILRNLLFFSFCFWIQLCIVSMCIMLHMVITYV